MTGLHYVCQKKKFNEKAIISRLNEFQKQFDNNAFKMHVFIGVYDIENLDEPVSIMCDKLILQAIQLKMIITLYSIL